MKRFSKIFSVILAFVFVLAFVGCLESADNILDASNEQNSNYISSLIDESSSVSESDVAISSEDITINISDVPGNDSSITIEESNDTIDENGSYTSAADVGLYIHTYGKLPSNFITKNQARELGWEGGGLEKYAPGKCIGGDRFGNYEGNLPTKKGRFYTECDIDTLGANSRGAKRIVFSNDGLVYYTEDHYETFTLLYGEE